MTKEAFEDKLAAQSAKESETKNTGAFYCGDCKKSFNSDNVYMQHLKSKAHLKVVADKKSKTQNAKKSGKGGDGNKDVVNKDVVSSSEGDKVTAGEGGDKNEDVKGENVVAEESVNSSGGGGKGKFVELQLTKKHCLFCSKKSKSIDKFVFILFCYFIYFILFLLALFCF